MAISAAFPDVFSVRFGPVSVGVIRGTRVLADRIEPDSRGTGPCRASSGPGGRSHAARLDQSGPRPPLHAAMPQVRGRGAVERIPPPSLPDRGAATLWAGWRGARPASPARRAGDRVAASAVARLRDRTPARGVAPDRGREGERAGRGGDLEAGAAEPQTGPRGQESIQRTRLGTRRSRRSTGISVRTGRRSSAGRSRGHGAGPRAGKGNREEHQARSLHSRVPHQRGNKAHCDKLQPPSHLQSYSESQLIFSKSLKGGYGGSKPNQLLDANVPRGSTSEGSPGGTASSRSHRKVARSSR